ncbi:hypothetical protein SAMN05216275_10551 [Streptosporangium canum]|uniref:Uncharacterized protein n=1 Tax=Streptosporangium canum TaxID=324952 RepID=A0A1I3L8Q1_9ACTN|nr:hypothetical protein [Streptosporangium canum]SFI81088.1 hypothetical protein SAMN05216275_10551 [Streptosporangium canum]
MKVWRVAHKTLTYNGFPSGPYVSKGIPVEVQEGLARMNQAHTFDCEHPSPDSDGGLDGIRNHERCGFDSREALDEWFYGFTKDLHDYGFCVYTYDLPDRTVRVGRFGQVVFSVQYALETGVEELEFTCA